MSVRLRPLGVAPGALAFVAAWIVAGLIARLTGTPVVLALMAALTVAVATDAFAGASTLRRFRVATITSPPTATAGADASMRVDLHTGTRAAGACRRDGRLRLTDAATGTPIGSEILAADARHTGTVITVRFERPGVVRALAARIDLPGPFGLVWWARTEVLEIPPIHVAPPPGESAVDQNRMTTSLDGAAPSRHGTHLGDVDGVRPWRDGDPVGAIHWTSSLRAGDLIVHDREATTDERWDVDLDALIAQADDRAQAAARLRRSLDDGLRRGHDIRVTHRGASHRVQSDEEAAKWAGIVADDPETSRPAVPFWRRPLRLTTAETTTNVPPTARWATALAAWFSLTMLIGALAGSTLFIAAVTVGLAVGAAVSLRLGDHRPRALQIAIAGVIVVALGFITADARDVTGLLDALRGPMPNLLVLLVVLHGFEVVDRRTLRVHQAITFVATAYAAGLRIDDALAWWIAGWATALVASLVLTVQRPRLAPPTTGAVGRAGLWTAGAVTATLALLSIVPIPDGPARLGLPSLSTNDTPIDTPGALAAPGGTAVPAESSGDRGRIGPTVGYPGFTDTLDTTIRGDLGDEVVMRVRAPAPAFWRGQTFSDFDGRRWTVSPDPGRRVDGPVIDVDPALGDLSAEDVPTEEFIQTYFVETDLPNVVFAAARPSRVVIDGDLWTRPDGALRSDRALTPGSVYTVVSERPLVTAAALREQGDLAEFFAPFRGTVGAEPLEDFLAVPASTTPRTIELARQLRQATTYDTILAYERWLGENTQYELDAPIPPDGADAVDDFLFESQLGYCEQIASTLAVMLRTQGVPARLATGYIPGERDRVSGVWKVRASDAHSWVEVWFPRTGWQAFDPTAAVPLAGETPTATVGGDLIGAATSSLSSHVRELTALAAGAVAVWALGAVLVRRRTRRRRGRWGILQDRFAMLPVRADGSLDGPAPGPSDGVPVLTNPQRAAHLDPPEVAMAVAATLDRAAFDPGFVDDDETYRATHAAVATLERGRR